MTQTLEIRGLSIRQPWTACFTAEEDPKDVENRSRRTSYRGLIALHASTGTFEDGALFEPHVRAALARIPSHALHRGAIIATAELTGCHLGDETCASVWCQPGLWHWEITGVRPLPAPVFCKGALGLWFLPLPALEAVSAYLADSEVPA